MTSRLCGACGRPIPEGGSQHCGLDHAAIEQLPSNELVEGALRVAEIDRRYAERQGWSRVSDAAVLADEIKRLREELKMARFAPMGDNHHNAMACPYCNPERPAVETSGSLLRKPSAHAPPGCHCTDRCMAPVLMGRQQPCRDPEKAARFARTSENGSDQRSEPE